MKLVPVDSCRFVDRPGRGALGDLVWLCLSNFDGDPLALSLRNQLFEQRFPLSDFTNWFPVFSPGNHSSERKY